MEALLYFIVWAGLLFLMMRFGCGRHVMGRGHTHHSSETGNGPAPSQDLKWVPPATDTDPVCGKTVRPEGAKSSVFDGTVYYFCSRDCREIFEAAPRQYVSPTIGTPQTQVEHSHG
ncbi:MAG: YHS domain-containing protein [Hyphomicrobiaceae bacterium]|nr:YHS domain-containing protein [Hyphomicrobiaceae bacterium]